MPWHSHGKDHPRMRGEKPVISPPVTPVAGSPPHARGKVLKLFDIGQRIRITPACAGKSFSRLPPSLAIRDHPRMRGEKVTLKFCEHAPQGSPPHARGKDVAGHNAAAVPGITPACAGKSLPGNEISMELKDHPRMRGEKVFLAHIDFRL